MFTALELGKEILASRVWGLRVQALKGTAPGEYNLEIYFNGKLFKTVNYNVTY